MTRKTVLINISCAAALLVLLAAAVLIWKLDMGVAGTTLGLLVAAAKAGLIAWIFMELRVSSPLVRLFAAAGLYWLVLLIALTLADFLTRG
jgi:cytochrome c oxidase subunit 4